jgi:hypothetical protein
VRGSRSKEPDNDGDITYTLQEVQESIDAAQHGNTIGDDEIKSQQILKEQASEEALKKEKIRQKEIEEVIINSTQRQADAINKTLQEIMYGPLPEKKEGNN